MYQRASQTYHATNVETVSKSGLIVKLYEGILRFLSAAEEAIQSGNAHDKGMALRRAGRIVEELSSSLDQSVEPVLAAQLLALYDYIAYELCEANMSSDLRHAGNARRVTEILLTAWRKVDAEASHADPTLTPVDVRAALAASGLRVSA